MSLRGVEPLKYSFKNIGFQLTKRDWEIFLIYFIVLFSIGLLNFAKDV